MTVITRPVAYAFQCNGCDKQTPMEASIPSLPTGWKRAEWTGAALPIQDQHFCETCTPLVQQGIANAIRVIVKVKP